MRRGTTNPATKGFACAILRLTVVVVVLANREAFNLIIFELAIATMRAQARFGAVARPSLAGYWVMLLRARANAMLPR